MAAMRADSVGDFERRQDIATFLRDAFYYDAYLYPSAAALITYVGLIMPPL